MKRFLVVCMLSVGLMALSSNKASAWKKWNFNIGMNISHESADNNFFWGLFRNGPHPFANGGGGGGGYMPEGGSPYYNPYAGTPGTSPGALPAPMQSAPAHLPNPMPAGPGQMMPQAAAQATQQSNIQPVSQTTTQTSGYWNYYYPYTAYNYWNAPSYWYNNN